MTRYHFEIKPPVTGSPITLSDPIANALMVIGIVCPMPVSWLMYFLWAAT